MVALTMIAVCFCYLVPYASYPRNGGGCPSVDSPVACWRYTAFLLAYVVACTLLLPLAAVGSSGALASGARRLADKGSTVRKGCFLHAKDLLVGSLGTIWSVANTSFISSAVSQVRYYKPLLLRNVTIVIVEDA